MKGIIRSVKDRITSYRHHAHKYLHDGHNYAHLAYFGGVFFEGHGFYSGMGGVLLILGVISLFAGDLEA